MRYRIWVFATFVGLTACGGTEERVAGFRATCEARGLKPESIPFESCVEKEESAHRERMLRIMDRDDGLNRGHQVIPSESIFRR